MAQVIGTNIASLNAQRHLNTSQGTLNTSLERLSSGLRINSAKDDAAGLAITERFTAQIRGLNQAQRNASDGISLAQTAEADLSAITNNLQRIRELAVQSANATNSSSDRAALQLEVAELVSEIDRVASSSAFNGVQLLDGTFTSQQFQVGANAGQTVDISSIGSAKTDVLGKTFEATSGTIASTNTASLTALVADDLLVNGTDVGIVATTTDFSGNIKTAIEAADPNVTVTVGAAVFDLGAFTTFTAPDNDEDYKLEVGGVTIIDVTDGPVTAGNIDAALASSTVQDELAAKGITVSGAAGTGLIFSKTDGSNLVVNQITTDADSDSTGGFAGGTLTVVDALTGTATTSNTQYGSITLTSESDIVIAGNNVGNIGLSLGTLSVSTTGTGTTITNTSVATVGGANAAIASADAALTAVNSSRASLGAVQNRFESVVTSIQTTSENLSAARSRIRDTDFAAETASLTKAQILQQAGVAMLSQANSLPQNVLSLLQ